MRSVQVLVVGGGASGMMAAISAAEEGHKVLLIEKKNKLGKKILATGNGKCNFTNEFQEGSCYHSDGDAYSVIKRFDEKACQEWFHKIGIMSKSRDGYVYPLSGQATSVNRALYRRLQELEVEIHQEEWLESIQIKKDIKGTDIRGYQVITNSDQYLTRNLILALGGAAAPVHGTTGDGYAMLANLGVSIKKIYPALTALTLKGKYMKDWAGVRVVGHIALMENHNNIIEQESGELQMVDYGISGIPVFQLSHHVGRRLDDGKELTLILDCLPDYSDEELKQEIERRRNEFKPCSLGDLLEGILPAKLMSALLKEAGIKASRDSKFVTDKEIDQIVCQMKHKELEIQGVRPFENAQVTTGGVLLSELDINRMELFKYPGIFIVGELANVDGICGGYNLQWAWSSGYVAGKAVGK